MGSEEGNWGPGIIGLAATCEGLVLIFIFLRIYTRVWIARAFWWDDFTIILAVLGTTIGCALCFVNVTHGFGKHIQFVDSWHLRQYRKYTFGEWIQTFATLMWTKISICLFLVRFSNNPTLRYAMYWCVGFLLFSNTIMTVMWIMSCQPVHTQWYGEGICMSRYEKEAIIMTQAIISIVSDFLFAAFPIFYFWRMQIDLKTKIGLWLLMCLGVITGACCIVRTVLNGDSIPDDETYDGIINWTWRLFEVQFGIIAACIPTLRPLYSHIAARWKGEEFFAESNIKFLPQEKEQAHRWIEDKDSDSSHPPTNTNPDRKHTLKLGGKQPAHKDDMQQELINDGILKSHKPNAHSHPALTSMPDLERGTSNAGLADDMQMYGIPADLSPDALTPSTSHPPTPRQLPKQVQESLEPAHTAPQYDGKGREGQGLDWRELVEQKRRSSASVFDLESGRESERSSERGRQMSLQAALDADAESENGVGPMQKAREWEPGLT